MSKKKADPSSRFRSAFCVWASAAPKLLPQATGSNPPCLYPTHTSTLPPVSPQQTRDLSPESQL
ncbi:hypothetical protein BOTBODRAFT_31736 [Botryobasidium botryosum FD-172 SS1]|uniref:Uncharacterized protein n=1 Tax=Botryobasidium botryosum (strain FD-172 SS1) TaxID=930990 RepID=A0A067MI19_BOTB1|nr:hypothetical protein BOTBODRAFT_31736 [Botryobasidium botryosum FD-172 SS1]